MWGRSGTRARGVAAALAAAAGLLVAAPQAPAAFGLANAVATPSSTDAGANADLTLGFDVVEPEADLRDLTIHLPPGLVGNPLATPMCTEAELAADACPATSDVGDVVNEVTASVLGFLPVPLTVNGDLFNVVPRAGEPARFGIVLEPTPVPIPTNPLLPKIILQSAASLRPTDFGLDTVLRDLPNTATVGGMPTQIDIDGLSLTLEGQVGSPPQGFIRLPTSCGTHTVGFDATAYTGSIATTEATFETANCAAIPFTPELSARIRRVGAVNDPVELSTTIAQTVEEAGLRRAQVILPAGLGGNNDVLANKCAAAEFEVGNCPAASIVGSATASSPLQSEGLTGTVALVEPAVPGLPDLGIDLRGPLALKLRGTLGFTPEGRNIVVFDDLPDIPIADFTLTFAGGPNGLVIPSRDVCEPSPLVFNANFLAHSGTELAAAAAASVDCSAATNGGGGGEGRRPRAKIALKRLGTDEPGMRLLIKGRGTKLRRASVKMPKQLQLASGKRFARGTRTSPGIKAKANGRRLRLRSKKGSAGLGARLANGALSPGRNLREGSRPRFAIRVRDVDGRVTKLRVRAK